MLTIVGQDFRCAMRALARRPTYAAITILVLAIAIGANTTVFSVQSGLFLLVAYQIRTVSAFDPVVLAGAVAAIVAAALLASWLPARRAGNTGPMIALRAE